jgi:hypothetical protein
MNPPPPLRWTNEIAIDPSATADATRLMLPHRTSAVNTLFLIVALFAGLVPAVAGCAARSDVRGPAGMTGVAPGVATGRTLRRQ